MRPTRVLLAGLGVVALWASAFPAIRFAVPELGVAGLSVVRLGAAAVALLVVAPLAGVRLPERADLPAILACGLFGMVGYQVFLNWGGLHVPAGTSSIIVAGVPVVSAAIAVVFLGERLTWFGLAGSAVALGGVAAVCLARSSLEMSGAAWIVVAALVAQGIYHPLSKPLLRRYTGVEVATYATVAGAVMVLPLAPFSWGALSSADPAALWAAAYLGLLPSALGFVLWGYTVSRLPVAASTSLLYLVPPVAVAVAFVWLGEVPVPAELLGGLVVVAGVVLIGRGDRLPALWARVRLRARLREWVRLRERSRERELTPRREGGPGRPRAARGRSGSGTGS